MGTAARILLVEDFQPYRSFIASLLSKNADLDVVGEVGDGLEAVARAEELKPDLILIDISLPKLNGLDAARRIRELVPSSKIIFLTQETQVEIVKEALNLGAWGYISKGRGKADLLAGLAAVLQGKRFVSNGLPGDGLSSTKPPER